MATAILLIEGASMEPSIEPLLVAHGYHVLHARNAAEGLALFRTRPLHAVLLHTTQVSIGWQQLIAAIRRPSQVPILVVSAHGSEDDQVRALDCGANAYVGRPFRQAELLARLRAVLRRASARAASRGRSVEIGPLSLQLDAKRVSVGGQEIVLTPTEFSLLEVMALRVGDVVTHSQLLREVWGATSNQNANTIRAFVFRLRRKLESTPSSPRLLHTAPGVGYKLSAPDLGGA